jgi:hypothetical protein
VIQVQLPLHGLDYGGQDETETVDDGVLVYPTQKFFRVLILSCKDSDEYRNVEIEADLERWSPKDNIESTEARMAQTDPDPCDVGV